MFSSRKAILGIILTAMLLTACQDTPQTAKPAALQPVQMQNEESHTLTEVTRGTFTSAITITDCQLVYQTDAYVVSDLPKGKLVDLRLYQRMEVKKGDVLAVLSIPRSDTDLEELTLSLERNREKLKSEKKAMEERIASMKDSLRKMESGTEKEIQKLELRKAEAQYGQYVLQMERSIKAQEKNIAKLQEANRENTIEAPFDGYVVSVNRLKAGDTINTGDFICYIIAKDHLFLGVKDEGKLRYNMEVNVVLRGLGSEATLKGRVVSARDVLPEDKYADRALVAVENILELENARNIAITADTVSLGNVLLADAGAVNTDQDKSFVSLYEDGQVRKRYIVMGKKGKEVTWILQGLSEHQSLVLK
jgi:multidrug efflux pump subunit AcrA (membrane-fusion protein)